ncbi:hypothetical protein [Pseudorhodobacter sp.]|uniref:hypothetical protein n=1 Tax=Pseudorhodobacter sp. TaxID=1934400 RepID=UPI0026496645|nr:hypothetical protein [Pseudorhodobacter sp.]MDN5788198.1 hypothetical protein [Pseudorhodobacter sp.]
MTLHRLAFFWVVLLTGCVTSNAPLGAAAQLVTIDGAQMSVRQEADMDVYGLMTTPDGKPVFKVIDHDKAVVVAGAKDQDMAIRAMGAFCKIAVDPKAWDTDYVHHFNKTNEYQFGGLCQ